MRKHTQEQTGDYKPFWWWEDDSFIRRHRFILNNWHRVHISDKNTRTNSFGRAISRFSLPLLLKASDTISDQPDPIPDYLMPPKGKAKKKADHVVTSTAPKTKAKAKPPKKSPPAPTHAKVNTPRVTSKIRPAAIIKPQEIPKAHVPRRKNGHDAPVSRGNAMGHHQGRTTRYYVMANGDIVMTNHVRLGFVMFDPLSQEQPITEASQMNYPGANLMVVELAPALLGEENRTMTHLFEIFEIMEANFHYVPATSTATQGSLLMATDADPDDEFQGGEQSLIELSSHPGAVSTQVWQACTCRMPKRNYGIFYTGLKSDTTADLRQTSQGTFRVMIDVPMKADDVSVTDRTYLGAMYLSYAIRFKKHGISSNFVGTGFEFILSAITPGSTYSMTTTKANIFNTLFTSNSWAVSYNYQNNYHMDWAPASLGDGTEISLRVPPGCWNVTHSIGDLTLARATTGSMVAIEYIGSRTNPGTATTGPINASTSISQATLEAKISRHISSLDAAITARTYNDGFRMLVRGDEFIYFTVRMTYSTGADIMTFTSIRFSFSASFMNEEESELVTPGLMSLKHRIEALESKLSVNVSDEKSIPKKRKFQRVGYTNPVNPLLRKEHPLVTSGIPVVRSSTTIPNVESKLAVSESDSRRLSAEAIDEPDITTWRSIPTFVAPPYGAIGTPIATTTLKSPANERKAR